MPSPRTRSGRGRRVALLAAGAVTLAAAATGSTVLSSSADAATTSIPGTSIPGAKPAVGSHRVETPLTIPGSPSDVAVSEVTIDAPLPASFPAHPAACDKLSYLRFRSTSGPAAPAQAARILVAEPGALAGASSLAQIARHTIEDAAAEGSSIEFWALDRRANCLEDDYGTTEAVKENDPSLALDYYTKGTVVNGHRFAGYVPNAQLAWLQDMGMEQTAKDEYTLLTEEVPDQAVRKSKVWCGGHSLGGVVTAFFAMSDFDGNPQTLGDAGYNQCAGYFALDTQIATSIDGSMPEPAALPGLVQAGQSAVDAAYSAGILPESLNIPVVNPETINLLALAGAYAKTRPTAVSPLPGSFGGNDNVRLALKFLLSKDAGAFLTGIPDITTVRITNRGALGALMDDNSSPISIIEASVGFFSGGPVADKSFPAGNDLLTIDALKGISAFATGLEKKAIPTDVGPIWDQGTGPAYTWLNYDQVRNDGSNIPKSSVDGKPFTTGASEVTDVNDLATDLSAYPLDFTEHYFPLAMMTDTALYGAGDTTVVPTAVHPEGLTAHPTVSLLGGDGAVAPVLEAGGKPLPANTLVLPGYEHLDVLTAAAKQNDGLPEQGAQYLSRFVLTH